MKGRNKEKKREDQVDELLRAAHDEILLNLSQSHIIAPPPDTDLSLDLERRFQALKMKSKSQPQEHLSARFDALKAKSSGSTLTASNSEDEEAQVQKLIQWAKDAARLDPSPPTDDDDDDDHSDT